MSVLIENHSVHLVFKFLSAVRFFKSPTNSCVFPAESTETPPDPRLCTPKGTDTGGMYMCCPCGCSDFFITPLYWTLRPVFRVAPSRSGQANSAQSSYSICFYLCWNSNFIDASIHLHPATSSCSSVSVCHTYIVALTNEGAWSGPKHTRITPSQVSLTADFFPEGLHVVDGVSMVDISPRRCHQQRDNFIVRAIMFAQYFADIVLREQRSIGSVTDTSSLVRAFIRA